MGGGFVGHVFRSLSNLIRKDDTQVENGHNVNSPSYTGSQWLDLQKWVDSHARDILDESDKILHSRFQLVYAIGAKQHVDGYPARWEITQQVLRLAKKHLYSISARVPHYMRCERGPLGSFPHVILQASDAGSRLTACIVEDVMAGRVPSVNFQSPLPPTLHSAIRSFISDHAVFQIPDTVRMVEEYALNSKHSYLWGRLLLLRGLLTSNILPFALSQRRWRVDYGPDLQSSAGLPIITRRLMLAVPYRAKDMPATNTRFGHPDLTIILTCLSYYYAGLTEEQLRVCLQVLSGLSQDDSDAEYALWIKELDSDRESLVQEHKGINWETLALELEPIKLWLLAPKLKDINLRSSKQWDNVIFPLFSRNQATIDFYLSQVVFPREARDFPFKLSGSSWDLAEKREKLITGA